MTTADRSGSPDARDALQRVLDETRARFVVTFSAQCDAIRVLLDEVAALGPAGPVAALTQTAHRLSGLAGTIGFPAISARASELEDLLGGVGTGDFEASRVRKVVDALRGAFAQDLDHPPVWSRPAIVSVQGAKILVAEDEADQRGIVMTCLQGAGYVPVAVSSGDLVLDTARAEQPALILLDIAMPRLDGFSVCRRLKADPDLAGIPVIFMTTGANLDDKLAGLTLGADEFLSKPIDLRELVLRVEILLERKDARRPPIDDDPCASKELTDRAFRDAVSEQMARSAVALAIVRLPADRHDEAAALLTEEIRGRDRIGEHGPTRLLILMPEVSAADARDRLEPVVARLIAQGLLGICIGITAASEAGVKSVEALIAEAGEALAEARHLGTRLAVWSERPEPAASPSTARTVLVAEDDPDVTRIIDAQTRAAGYATILAFDGEEALAAVASHAPDVLVLDLMMPKLDGFDVLTRIRESAAPRPRIIVLSGRGREQDVVRAFELGADDYMTKPFNPQELMARIARLLK